MCLFIRENKSIINIAIEHILPDPKKRFIQNDL